MAPTTIYIAVWVVFDDLTSLYTFRKVSIIAKLYLRYIISKAAEITLNFSSFSALISDLFI